jgi:hypothetical protein
MGPYSPGTPNYAKCHNRCGAAAYLQDSDAAPYDFSPISRHVFNRQIPVLCESITLFPRRKLARFLETPDTNQMSDGEKPRRINETKNERNEP